MVPHLWLREFIEIVFVKQVIEISAPVQDHLFKRLGLLLHVGFSSEVIHMMGTYENGLCEVYCKDGFSLL